MTTQLQAVNRIISTIGQAPISTLEGNNTALVTTALNCLAEEKTACQLRGWYFNTDKDYPLNPDSEGFIYVPPDSLVVDIPSNPNIVQRKGKLYNKIDFTYVFDKQQTATIVWDLDLVDLHQAAQNYIIMKAAQKFTKRMYGSTTSYAYTTEDLEKAYADLLEVEMATGNSNILSDADTQAALNRKLS